MLRRKQGLVMLAAACAALVGANRGLRAAGPQPAGRAPLLMDDSTAAAQATTNPSAAYTTTAPAIPGPAPATTPATTPLMGLLGPVGVGMSNAGFSLTGFVEGAYTYDTSNPPGNVLTDRAFDQRSNSIGLDQVELDLARTNDFGKPIDFGVNFESIYGADAAYFHSNGLTLTSYGSTAPPFPVPGAGNTTTIHPKAQYDLTQANFTISSNALFKGIAFEGGKFTTLLGAELIDPYTAASTNAFYSHSFIFTQEPFTHTGALGIVNLNDAFTFTGGITRGWDQATEDNNGNIDFIGQVKFVVNTKATVYLNGITGNEQPDAAPGTVGRDGYRTVFDVVGSYALSDQLSVSANGMYAFESQTGNIAIDPNSTGGTSSWYGVAAYASYKLSDNFTVNARGEWFDDQDGAAPTQYSSIRQSNQFYEATLGVTIHPLPNNPVLNNLFFRPEVRFDYANHAAFDTVGGLPTNRYFLSGAVDGVFAF